MALKLESTLLLGEFKKKKISVCVSYPNILIHLVLDETQGFVSLKNFLGDSKASS